MSVSYWQSASDNKVYECDVAVIGAGIIGAYTAYKLAEAGKRVAILESRFPAAGATGRNAGMCLTGAADNYAVGVQRFGRDRAQQLWQLTIDNQRQMRSMVEKFGTPYMPCGSYILAIDEAESELLTQAYALMREDGFAVGFHASDPLERGFGAAIEQPADFGLNPAALVQALIANAPGDRVRLFAPAPAYAINETGDKLQVVARGITVTCQQVALCTNAYSPLVSPYFADKVFPRRGQILMTAPVGHKVMDKLAYANYGYEYFRQLDDGSFLLGGGRGYHKELEVGYDETPTAWVQATLEGFLAEHFPDVVGVPIVRRWAGIMGFAADGLPMVGRLPNVPGHFAPVAHTFTLEPPTAISSPASSGPTNIFFAVGFTGHGLGWGLATADLMLGQILGQRNDGGLFDVARLAD